VREQMSEARVMWVRATPEARALELLRQVPVIQSAETVEGRIKVTLADHDTDPGIVAETLVRGGVRLVELRDDEIGLEEVFLRVTKGETQ